MITTTWPSSVYTTDDVMFAYFASIILSTNVYVFSVPSGVFLFFIENENSCSAPADATALSSLCVISEMAGG